MRASSDVLIDFLPCHSLEEFNVFRVQNIVDMIFVLFGRRNGCGGDGDSSNAANKGHNLDSVDLR